MPPQARGRILVVGDSTGAGVWAGVANVGLAPLFLPPFFWVLSARTRRVTRLLRACAREHGAEFVDFFRERATDPFSADPARYYAADRVHPSAAAACAASSRRRCGEGPVTPA